MPRFALTRPAVLGIVIVAVAAGALAGCAPATTSSPGSASSGPAGTSQGSSAPAGAGSCAEFTAKSLAGLVNVPVGKPFVAGSDSAGGVICWYGIGKNAGVVGSSIETLADDSILITTIGVDGQSQYAHFTGSDVNAGPVTAISGIGDKAAYSVSVLTGNVPELYAVHGSLYCGIQLNVQTSELVDPSPAGTARDEGALCQDAFAQH